MLTLTQLMNSCGSDKGSRVGDRHNYSAAYGVMFEQFRDRRINLLEFGVALGSSVRAWLEYFPEGEIFGVDYSFEHLGDGVPKDHKRLHLLQGDVTDAALVPDLAFDIMIDDSNHTIRTQVETLLAHWSKLAPGGLYVIEDLFVGRLPWGGEASTKSRSFLWPYSGYSTSPTSRMFPRHPQDLYFLNRSQMPDTVSAILNENEHFFTISSISKDGGLHMMLVIRRSGN